MVGAVQIRIRGRSAWSHRELSSLNQTTELPAFVPLGEV